jgi:hypothetical protein
VFNENEQILKSLAYRKMFQEDYFFYSDMSVGMQEQMAELVNNIDVDKVRQTALIGDVKSISEQLQKYVSEGVKLFSVRLYDDEFEKFGEVINAINS